MKRLLSGIQPTGTLHLGNYLGAIKQWVEYQYDYESFFMVADLHTLTAHIDPESLYKQTFDSIAMLVALGIDPKVSAIFLQSQISSHTELSWIFSNFTSIGQLNRMTQYKEKSDRYGQNVGLFTYPILQAADIAIYQAEVVPVGQDQVQHLELSREIIRNFNSFIGRNILTEPNPLLTRAAKIMALNDPNKKMSKSISGSAINILATGKEVEKAIKHAVTDSGSQQDNKMSPGLQNLFTLLEAISSEETAKIFNKKYQDNKLSYSELKEQLTEDIIAFLGPIQKTYHSLRADEKSLEKIIEQGRIKAEPIAKKTLSEVKKELGLIN